MQRKVQELIAQKKVFLLDLDGTLYLDETPIGDMAHTLEALREHGKRVVYLTNTSSKTAEEYVRKLSRIGFYREGDLVYTSAMATAEYLRAAYPQKKVYLAATDAVKAEFFENGIEHSEEEGEIAVLAYDTTIDFRKFCKLNELIVAGERDKATELQYAINEIIYKMCSSHANMYSVAKEMLRVNAGLDIGGVREPLEKLQEADKAIAKAAAEMVCAAKAKYL